jgi:hypothetical protein
MAFDKRQMLCIHTLSILENLFINSIPPRETLDS